MTRRYSPERDRRSESWWSRLGGVFGGRRKQPRRYAPRTVVSGPYRPPGVSYGRRTAYGTQARRRAEDAPYALAFLLIIGLLAGFFYFGLNWATGSGRTAGLGPSPSPAAVTSPSPLAAASPSPAATATPVPGADGTYTVQGGDTLASIARQLNMSLNALIEANPDIDPQALQPGQELIVPERPGP